MTADTPPKVTHARITALPRPMPEGMADPMPQVWVRLDGGEETLLFAYYHDEITFNEREFLGLSLFQARALKVQKDKEFLKT